MRNIFRDNTRDRMAENLAAAGIKAEMVDRDRGRPEEKIRSGNAFLAVLTGYQSLGLIDILEDDLIRWVHVIRVKRRDKNGPARHRVVFGIPDESIPMKHQQLRIKTVREKTFPIFGKVTDVHWESKAHTKSLAKVLSEDADIDNAVAELGDMSIYTHPGKFQGWTVELGKIFIPTETQWAALHKIASYLLSSPRG